MIVMVYSFPPHTTVFIILHYEIFTRQRRNLMLVSTFYLFVITTSASVDSIPLIGISIDIHKSNTLVIYFWALFLLTYFIIRYLQSMNQYALPIVIENYTNTFKEKFRIKAQECNDFIQSLDKTCRNLPEIAQHHSLEIKPHTIDLVSCTFKHPDNTLEGLSDPLSGIFPEKYALEVEYKQSGQRPTIQKAYLHNQQFDLKPHEALIKQTIALTKKHENRNKLTYSEYILPFNYSVFSLFLTLIFFMAELCNYAVSEF